MLAWHQINKYAKKGSVMKTFQQRLKLKFLISVGWNFPSNQALNQFFSFILVDSGKLPQRINVKIPWSKADRKAKGCSLLMFIWDVSKKIMIKRHFLFLFPIWRFLFSQLTVTHCWFGGPYVNVLLWLMFISYIIHYGKSPVKVLNIHKWQRVMKI